VSLSDTHLHVMNAYWRAASDLSVGQWVTAEPLAGT
jgi:phosphoketolase